MKCGRFIVVADRPDAITTHKITAKDRRDAKIVRFSMVSRYKVSRGCEDSRRGFGSAVTSI